MKKYHVVSALLMTTALAFSSSVVAAVSDHQEIGGPFATPMEVTQKCLECHEDASKQVMATSHWTWSRDQDLEGKGLVKRGKKNVLNNFCISINGNWARCTSCHVGYGWKDASFDFNDESRVDCLICHDSTGTYVKSSAGAGLPAGFTGNPKFDKKPVDLIKIAQNVSIPKRSNCLSCHANGGGGNAVKHGDIDISLINPEVETDYHMSKDGQGFSCQECHKTDQHGIVGNALVVSPGGTSPVGCEDCHEGAPHAESILNSHLDTVSCQTCHIPAFAKVYATKMSWDWSQAKNPAELPEDKRIIKEHGHAVYMFKKGRFTYEENVTPTYAWYNGTAGAYQLGDKINPAQVTKLNYPLGDKNDTNAKIHPFKVHKGNQIYDSKNNYLITPKVWGPKGDPDAFWVNFDWDKAATAGMKASDLQYSGEYGFAPTETYWPTNHMVSPKDEALGCLDCHGDNGRLDWKGLGYGGDPLKERSAARTK